MSDEKPRRVLPILVAGAAVFLIFGLKFLPHLFVGKQGPTPEQEQARITVSLYKTFRAHNDKAHQLHDAGQPGAAVNEMRQVQIDKRFAGADDVVKQKCKKYIALVITQLESPSEQTAKQATLALAQLNQRMVALKLIRSK